MKDSIIVKDDFSPYTEQVKASAYESGFGTWTPNKGIVGTSIYEGMNYVGRHDLMLRALSGAMGTPVYPALTFFRVTKPDTEPAYIHSDRTHGDWTCIVYLSEHKERSGTAFYRHRESGMTEMPSFEDLAKTPELFDKLKTQMVTGSEDDWEMTDFVSGRFNRALIFNAPLFHSRFPKQGLGDGSDESGRLVHVTHFYV